MRHELMTVPTLNFNQGDPFAGDQNCEYPIQVQYYRGCICLEQNGQTINILPEHLNELFKQIKKNLPEAERFINRK